MNYYGRRGRDAPRDREPEGRCQAAPATSENATESAPGRRLHVLADGSQLQTLGSRNVSRRRARGYSHEHECALARVTVKLHPADEIAYYGEILSKFRELDLEVVSHGDVTALFDAAEQQVDSRRTARRCSRRWRSS